MENRTFIDEWLAGALVPLGITAAEIDGCRAERRRHLSQALADSGRLTPERIGAAVEAAFGIKYLPPDADKIDKFALALVPPSVCRKYCLLPVKASGGEVEVAMSDPRDASVLAELGALTGRAVVPFFSLPRDIEASFGRLPGTAEPAPGPAGAVPAGKPRVLVADDDKFIRLLLRKFLEARGCEVLEAGDGDEALAAIAAAAPDLLVSDVNMPKMSGPDLVKGVRATLKLEGLPVIMITADTAEKGQELASAVGAADYIVKPFKPDVVVARITAALRRAGKLR